MLLMIRAEGLAVRTGRPLKSASSGAVLRCQCNSNSSDKRQRKFFAVREGQVALWTSKGFRLFDQAKIVRDRGIDADMLLESSEVEERALFLERGHVVADGPRRPRDLGFDYFLDHLQSTSDVGRLRRKVLLVGLVGHAGRPG